MYLLKAARRRASTSHGERAAQSVRLNHLDCAKRIPSLADAERRLLLNG